MRHDFDAVIFDLDGVITKTARLHAKAWKKVFDEYLRRLEKTQHISFRPFTHEEDYLAYVDGKPRYKGVESFLLSRNISLPHGSPADAPEAETVCGIGNNKNRVFKELLQKEGAEIYTSSVELIRTLREEDIRVGIASSSRNCRSILKFAGLEKLFETRVDGEVSVKLGLAGKPAGDIFVLAARNLGTQAIRAVVVEDASSGVKAGRNGGFGLVIGIARKNNASALLKNGADVVVRDLSEMRLSWMDEWFRRAPRDLFAHWETPSPPRTDSPLVQHPRFRESFLQIVPPGPLTIFLNYDGILTPIVDRPEHAILTLSMRHTLEKLSRHHRVVIISGRMREELQRLVSVDRLVYAGSHGFDMQGPSFSLLYPKVKACMPDVKKAGARLHRTLGDVPGVLIEGKKISVAVHYRLTDEEKYLGVIRAEVDAILEDCPALRLLHGKKVFELLPDIEWDKGKAICWIMKALKISWSKTTVLYLGDDTADEFAFHTVRTRGVGIMVSETSVASGADFRVASPEKVQVLFEKILSRF